MSQQDTQIPSNLLEWARLVKTQLENTKMALICEGVSAQEAHEIAKVTTYSSILGGHIYDSIVEAAKKGASK